MSNAKHHEQTAQPRLFQRISSPVFFLIALLIVPTAAFVGLILGATVVVAAGIQSEAQNWIMLTSLLLGFFGSIYLLVRARRDTVTDPKGIRNKVAPPPVLVVAQDAEVQGAL